MLGLIWGVSTTGGYTLSAFSGQTANAGNTFTAAATFGPEFVQQVGTVACGGASSALAVPASGVAAGNTLVAILVLRDNAPAGAVDLTDSRGNSYTADVDFTNGSVRTIIFSGRVATALAPGDVLTATHPDVDAEAFAAAEFSGIATPPLDAAGSAGGISANPTVSATTANPDNILVGASGNQGNRTYTEAAGWTTMSDVSTTCGGGAGRITLHSAFRSVASAGAWTYDPALSANDRWAAGIAAYRG